MKTDWTEKKWQLDVASFARWLEFYNKSKFSENRQRVLQYLKDLQDKWPNHKLGDMPKEV